MSLSRRIESKILGLDALLAERARLRELGRTVVFTNGCFDILHAGHVDYLAFAREQGDALVVGLNADSSVRAAKGPERPFNRQADRARVLAALEAVDYVTVFDEPEPAALIARLVPDVLVKGEDWAHYVSGRDVVERNGGRVVLAPLRMGCSTTGLAERIRGAGGRSEAGGAQS